MDKETLSNYGWIVICVLVLAVMIALATPFGTFVADGFKATYTGLFQTGDNAMDTALGAVGVSNKLPCGHGRKEAGDHSQKGCGHYNCQDTDCGCVPASCGVDGHWSGDGMDHTTKVNHTGHTYACQCSGWVVPNGGTYTMTTAVDGKSIFNAGESLPCGYEPKYDDKYEYGDYKYTYLTTPSGWNVRVLDNTKAVYGVILENINGQPVSNMTKTFQGCTNIITAPVIPSSVTTLYQTFYGCSSLTTAPVIPNSVTRMYRTFYECSSLVVAPVIPSTVYDMYQTFYNCTSLTTAPVIPSGVSEMRGAFYYCKALTGTVTINSNPSNYSGCFYGVDFEAQNLTLDGSCTMLDTLGATGTNYCATCNGKCQGNH